MGERYWIVQGVGSTIRNGNLWLQSTEWNTEETGRLLWLHSETDATRARILQGRVLWTGISRISAGLYHLELLITSHLEILSSFTAGNYNILHLLGILRIHLYCFRINLLSTEERNMKEYQTSQRDCKTFFQVHKYLILINYYVVKNSVTKRNWCWKGIFANTWISDSKLTSASYTHVNKWFVPRDLFISFILTYLLKFLKLLKTLNAPGEDVTQCSNQCILCCYVDIHWTSWNLIFIWQILNAYLDDFWFLKMMPRFTNQCSYSNLGNKAEICQEKSPRFNSKVSDT